MPGRVVGVEREALVDRQVVAQAVPRAGWEGLFRSQGMAHPLPRMRMLDGFNDGWIDFDPGSATLRRGTTTVQAVVDGLVERTLG